MEEKKANFLANKGVLKLKLEDEKSLYLSYMPFVKGCGLFVESEADYKLGDEAFVLVTLPADLGRFAVSAKVIWKNPKRKAGRRLPGVGLQILGKDAITIKEKIEDYLGKKVKSPLPTITM